MANKKGQIKDLTGQKFGRLTVVNFDHKDGKKIYWYCTCECGGEKIVLGNYLRNGETKSCGCLQKEHAKELTKAAKHKNTVPFDVPFRRKLYYVWSAMKQRCCNANNKHYKWYGSRGIKVCNEWLDKENGFMNFYNWAIDNGYKEGLTIDRLDVNGNYKPNNCAWKTQKEQASNMTTNVLIEYEGKAMTAVEWKEKLNLDISDDLIRRRWKRGIRGDGLFSLLEEYSSITIQIDNKIKSLKEWAEYTNINYQTLLYRYNKGIRGNDLILPVEASREQYYGHPTVNNIIVAINNINYSLKDVAKLYNIKIDTIKDRYKLGLRGEDLIKPTGMQFVNNTYVEIEGKILNLKEVSKLYDIPIEIIKNRYQKGLREEQLISNNKLRKKKKIKYI